jgi:uncharacterized protein
MAANAEPSMEEILSSIKRIIAEDAEATLSAPRPKRSVGLTPMVPPMADAVPSADEADEHDVLELTDPVAVEPEPEAEEMPVEAPKLATESAPPKPTKKPALVSSETAEASRSALSALSALIVKPEIEGSDTLEGLVREMLKPMLAEWLDANLPAIVERQVAQEIARITARG